MIISLSKRMTPSSFHQKLPTRCAQKKKSAILHNIAHRSASGSRSDRGGEGGAAGCKTRAPPTHSNVLLSRPAPVVSFSFCSSQPSFLFFAFSRIHEFSWMENPNRELVFGVCRPMSANKSIAKTNRNTCFARNRPFPAYFCRGTIEHNTVENEEKEKKKGKGKGRRKKERKKERA